MSELVNPSKKIEPQRSRREAAEFAEKVGPDLSAQGALEGKHLRQA